MNDRPIADDEVLAAIYHGKHGVAPGLSGFSREFYQHFSKDLIGFIMNYVKYTEEIGILWNRYSIEQPANRGNYPAAQGAKG